MLGGNTQNHLFPTLANNERNREALRGIAKSVKDEINPSLESLNTIVRKSLDKGFESVEDLTSNEKVHVNLIETILYAHLNLFEDLRKAYRDFIDNFNPSVPHEERLRVVPKDLRGNEADGREIDLSVIETATLDHSANSGDELIERLNTILGSTNIDDLIEFFQEYIEPSEKSKLLIEFHDYMLYEGLSDLDRNYVLTLAATLGENFVQAIDDPDPIEATDLNSLSKMIASWSEIEKMNVTDAGYCTLRKMIAQVILGRIDQARLGKLPELKT